MTGLEPAPNFLKLVNWELLCGYSENPRCCSGGGTEWTLPYAVTPWKQPQHTEQQDYIKHTATDLSLKSCVSFFPPKLERSSLKEHHEWHSSPPEPWGKGFGNQRVFIWHSCCFGARLMCCRKHTYIWQDFQFWCFLFQTKVLRGFLGFRKAERVQNKMDYILCNEHKLSTENNLTGFSVRNQVTTFYAFASTPLTQGACFYQKYKK